jgi:plastocyanin domain-containing protein
MSGVDRVVIVGGVALIVFLLRFFFEPKQGKAAVLQAGVQEATIRVEGAYQPNVMTVKAGTPVWLTFDQHAATDCANRAVLSDFGSSRTLTAFRQQLPTMRAAAAERMHATAWVWAIIEQHDLSHETRLRSEHQHA